MTFSPLWRRVKDFVTRDRWARDLDEEMRLHVDLRAAANRADGMDPDAARRAARVSFGNEDSIRERARDAWGGRVGRELVQDLRHACRRLLIDPAVTASAVLTLAIGIGGSAAMLALVDRALFKPAPVGDPHRVVWVVFQEVQSGAVRRASYPDYAALREAGAGLSGLAAFTGVPLALGGEGPQRLTGLLVSPDYFDVLGVPLSHGRGFRPDEGIAGVAHRVVVLSDTLWRRRFGGDAGLVGQDVTINGRPFTVVGIAPPGFRGLDVEPIDAFLPLGAVGDVMPDERALSTSRRAAWLDLVGRLAPGVSAVQAQTGLETASAARDAFAGDQDAERRVLVQPVAGVLDPQNRGDAMPALGALSVIPLFVLFVACANVGNLLLARGVSRHQELAIRRVLGATRNRLVRQLLAESVLLALAGCAVGVAMAFGLTAVIGSLIGVTGDISSAFTPDLRTLFLSALLALVAGAACGLAPALIVTGRDAVPSLKAAEATLPAALGGRRFRSTLVVAQVAISFFLVCLAGLLYRSVSKTLQTDPGFDVRHAVALSYDLRLQRYDDVGRRRFDANLLQAARALPSAEAVALVSTLPLSGRFVGEGVIAEEQVDRDVTVPVGLSTVSPGYFTTMRMRLTRGRDVAGTDTPTGPPVVIVNESLAAQLWPGADALGHRLRLAGDAEPWREVVGVTVDGKYDDFAEPARAFLYLPQSQYTLPWQTLVARGSGNLGPLIAGLRQIIHQMDPNLPVYDVKTLEEVVRNAVDRPRAAAMLLSVFGAAALVLAALGLHALTAHAVAVRTREIGIRMSLGATSFNVVSFVMRQTFRLALIGVGVGGGVGLATAWVLASLVYSFSAADVLPYGLAAALVLLVTGVASGIPARLAAAAHPLDAIRHP